MKIEFSDSEYRFESGHAPRGFSFEGYEFWAHGTLTQAKRQCMAEVRRLAPKDYASTVYVTIMP